jgi:endonuclease/exonuclease/phosphatase (EEP) superfamily protein YafD
MYKRPKGGLSLSGLVEAGGFVAAVASLAGFFGRFAWWADLCSHFRLHYLLIFAVLAIGYGLAKRKTAALLFLALALVNLVLVLGVLLPRAPLLPSAGSPIRAMLINVDTYHGNPDAVIAAIRREDPDLVVLEEINRAWKGKVEDSLERLPYRIAEPQEDNFGIMALSRIPWRTAEIVFLGESGVPSVSAVLDTPKGPLMLIGTHPEPPAGGRRTALRNEQLERVAEYVNGVNMPVLLLGDLNCTPWCRAFSQLMDATGLRDASRGRGIHATWPAFAGKMGLPLDHALYGPGIQIQEVRVGDPVGSDHLPLIVVFEVRK